MSRTKGYKCFNIKCGSCIGKTLCGEPADTALGCDSRVVGKKLTNADRIRAMSDEELTTFISEIADECERNTECNQHCYGCDIEYCVRESCLKWLQQPAEEDGKHE